MSKEAANPFERADVFHLFDGDSSVASSSPSAAAQGNTTITEVQYKALVQMMASSLGLTADDAERLFPSYRVEATQSTDAFSAREPPLCAHLVREGAEVYWSQPSPARLIPDVRCCDARDFDKREPFPDAGHGPHVHCLYCFHTAIENAPPAGRGVPPPVVEDFRDAASLQAHQQTHHDRYVAYLKMLEDCSDGSVDAEADALSDERKAACEVAAEQESRHVCYMAAIGTSACPVVVFYCAECDCFAPLVRFRPSDGSTEDGSATAVVSTEAACEQVDACAWTSTEEWNVILSRLLLSCHVLHMIDSSRFAGGAKGARDAAGSSAERTRPRHIVYLFKPILFHEGVEEKLVEEFEDGAECTYTAVVLPHASVAGEPPELLLLHDKEIGQDAEDRSGTDGADNGSPQTYAPVVVGFAMEWASEALLQSKLNLILRQHELGCLSSGVAVPPFHVALRWVYIEDTEEWVEAHVPYHRTATTQAALPCAYADAADEGIRVAATYKIDAPLPTTEENKAPAASSLLPPSPKIVPSSSNVEVDGSEEDPLAPDGCPYSMESRTIDFFVRMTALAKAMHELATWRLSIDENKEGLP